MIIPCIEIIGKGEKRLHFERVGERWLQRQQNNFVANVPVVVETLHDMIISVPMKPLQ